MSKIPFNVSARTARLIGRENVANADGAVIELVKNGHDADAKKVIIVFDKNGDLYITDNGHGMTEKAIMESWMTIGTDNKEVKPYSPKGRIKAGAKGIGRFALDRLGEKVEMFTLPEGKMKGFYWSIDWNEFEKKGMIVNEVKADFEEKEKLNLLQKLPEFLKLQNNFFSNGGTVIKISSLRDKWEEKDLKALYTNLETLVPPMEKDSFSIDLIMENSPEKFGSVKPLINQDFDYRLVTNYDSVKKILKVKVERREFDISALEKKHSQVFSFPQMTKQQYTLETFKKGYYKKEYKIEDIVRGYKNDDKLLEKVGDFSFILTFAKIKAPNKEDLRKYPYKNVEYASRNKWLNQFSGIKIFRDNFRVRPYGENGDDWLRLGDRQAQSPAGPGQRMGGYKVRPTQVAGAVNISRIHNIAFQDKSSREGIQENNTFDLFKNILLEVISILENDRNTIFYNLSELYKKTDEKERIKNEAREAAERIKKESKDNAEKEGGAKWNEDAEKVAEALDVLEEEIVEKHEEIKILRSLASAGLITAAVAHELRGLENILSTRNKDLRQLLRPFIKEDDFKDTKDAFNPFILMNEMEKTDISLQEWLNYALMPLKRDKRMRKKIFLNDYFNKLGKMWSNLLSERKISLNIKDIEDLHAVMLFPIDMDTIFNNLIINSIESFSRRNDTGKREIKISCKKQEKTLTILYQDNGAGLDPCYRKDPTLMFLPQETTKRDSSGKIIGTGMGMYLIKSVIDENNGNVDVESSESGFLIRINLLSVKKV